MIVPVIERMDDRMDAIFAALVAALPARVCKRSYFRHYTEHPEAEIVKGVAMLISNGEGDYKAARAASAGAKEGVHTFLVIGHLKADEDSEPQAIEAAELDLIEEIKDFTRIEIPGLSLRLTRTQHSRQVEHPYGWVVAFLEAGPPIQNTH